MSTYTDLISELVTQAVNAVTNERSSDPLRSLSEALQCEDEPPSEQTKEATPDQAVATAAGDAPGWLSWLYRELSSYHPLMDCDDMESFIRMARVADIEQLRAQCPARNDLCCLSPTGKAFSFPFAKDFPLGTTQSVEMHGKLPQDSSPGNNPGRKTLLLTVSPEE